MSNFEETDIDTLIYNYLKKNAYDTSVPNELKIELDGTKFILSFLDAAIYTVDKRFRTVYGSKFSYLPYLFYEDGKVVVEENDDSVDIEIYHRGNLVETHTLKPVLEEDETKPHETRPPEVSYFQLVIMDKFIYARKRIFRHEFNSDAIITQLNLSEDVKECIFKEFDEFSDRFSDVYKGIKSFLPYRYLFFKLLRNVGFSYTYECTFQKMKAMEKIYWSLKDAKDYEEFIRFLNHGANIVCEKEYKVFDSPKKIVISEFKHSLKEAYYLLTVKDELDLVIQYFTKFLSKINKRPEYQYNLIIMEMEEEKMEITFESIFFYILDELNERMNLNVMFMIKEEIN